MRKAVLVIGFLSGASGVVGQCPNNNISNGTINASIPSSVEGNGSATSRAGQYVSLNWVTIGRTYTINVQNATWNVDLTLYSNAGGPPLAYSNDKVLTWTSTVAGTVRILLDESCGGLNTSLVAAVNVSWYTGQPVPEDCMGATTICSSSTLISNTTSTGYVADLNAYNRGCIGNTSPFERQGTWYAFAMASSGNLAFTISPLSHDYDFALWGPYSQGSTKTSICTPSGQPLRCSFSQESGPTGLSYTATSASEGAGGDRWVSAIPTLAGEVYLLYISNYSQNGLAFTLTWQLTNGASLDCGVILPVELLSFDGHHEEQGNTLEWSTATEQNNDYFTISRSIDAIDWTPIATIPGAGTSQSTTSYSYVDRDYPYTMNYYRLEQTDIDGQHQNLRTISIDNSKDNNRVILRTNLMGQEVDENYRGHFIEYRERGVPVMRFQ